MKWSVLAGLAVGAAALPGGDGSWPTTVTKTVTVTASPTCWPSTITSTVSTCPTTHKPTTTKPTTTKPTTTKPTTTKPTTTKPTTTKPTTTKPTTTKPTTTKPTTTKPTTTKTTTKPTTTKPTTTASPKPTCVRYNDDNFDNLHALPIPEITDVGQYNGANYNLLLFDPLLQEEVIGITPHSEPNFVGYSFLGAVLQGAPAITPAPGYSYLDLESFWYACAVADANTIATLPVTCTIQADGYYKGNKVTTQQFTYNQGLLGGITVKSPMIKGVFNSGFAKVDNIEFSTVAGFAGLGIAVAPGFDDFTYQACK